MTVRDAAAPYGKCCPLSNALCGDRPLHRKMQILSGVAFLLTGLTAFAFPDLWWLTVVVAVTAILEGLSGRGPMTTLLASINRQPD
jgi:hypothetical protein